MSWWHDIIGTRPQAEAVVPRFVPSRPWILASFRPGGGKLKRLETFGSQAEAAAELRAAIAGEDQPAGDRYVFRVGHVSSQREVEELLDTALSRADYTRLARIQAAIADAGAGPRP
jgi:hypothetical protein